MIIFCSGIGLFLVGLSREGRLFVVGGELIEWFGDSRDKYLSRLFFSQHRIPHPQGLLYNIKIMIKIYVVRFASRFIGLAKLFLLSLYDFRRENGGRRAVLQPRSSRTTLVHTVSRYDGRGGKTCLADWLASAANQHDKYTTTYLYKG
jgi:hypothetical protein